MTGPVLGPNRPARRKFLWDVEVRILAFGLFLTLLTVVALGIGWLVNPELAARFAAMTRLNLTGGWAGASLRRHRAAAQHLRVGFRSAGLHDCADAAPGRDSPNPPHFPTFRG